jgi:YfiH family protein
MSGQPPPISEALSSLVQWVEPRFEPISDGIDMISGLFPSGVLAVQTHRSGGASAGPYASFNLASHVGDREELVRQNRNRLEKCCATKPAWLEQIHGAQVLELDRHSDRPEPMPAADAALTGQGGHASTVMTADCLPILVSLTHTPCVLAIHAGWRGLAAGVIEAGLQAAATRLRGSDQWSIWLGPCIGPDAYEVGAEVRQAFIDQSPLAGSAFRESPNRADKFYADLRALAQQRIFRWFERHPEVLLTGGSEIGDSGRPIRIGINSECTYQDRARYYSFRRQSVTGRMASLIALKPI